MYIFLFYFFKISKVCKLFGFESPKRLSKWDSGQTLVESLNKFQRWSNFQIFDQSPSSFNFKILIGLSKRNSAKTFKLSFWAVILWEICQRIYQRNNASGNNHRLWSKDRFSLVYLWHFSKFNNRLPKILQEKLRLSQIQIYWIFIVGMKKICIIQSFLRFFDYESWMAGPVRILVRVPPELKFLRFLYEIILNLTIYPVVNHRRS